VGDKFDWRDHPFGGNQALTVTTLRANVRSMAA
jgi:hypothetical protein